MRKIAIVSAILFFVFTAWSQDKADKMVFTKVVNDSSIKPELFSKLKLAIAEVYNSANDVVQAEDKENGVFVVKALFLESGSLVMSPYNYKITYSLKIEVKDGRYRMVVSDMTHHGMMSGRVVVPDGGPLERERPACGTFSLPMGKWRSIKSQAEKRVTDLFAAIEAKVKANNLKTDSDW